MARPDPVAGFPALSTSALATAGAAASPPGAEMVDRLATQLNVLSELLETITYRLLELEERVAAQDLRIQAIHDQLQDPAAAAVGLSDDAELRLDDTEERLNQLEALLNGMASPDGAAAARHLQPVPLQQPGGLGSDPAAAGNAGPEDSTGPEDSFPEEGEQPFMDELEADLREELDDQDSLSA